MLALCLILSMTCYAQNYAGIIGWSLIGTFASAFRRFVLVRKTSGKYAGICFRPNLILSTLHEFMKVPVVNQP